MNVTTGVSKPTLTGGVFDLNSINVSGGAGGTLEIGITDTDFGGSFPAYTANFGGTTTGSVQLDAWHDASNVEFGGASLPGAPVSVSGPSFSGSASGSVSPGRAPTRSASSPG